MSPARLEKLKADIAAYDADMAQFGDDLETSPELCGDAGSARARDLNARLDAIVIEARELSVYGDDFMVPVREEFAAQFDLPERLDWASSNPSALAAPAASPSRFPDIVAGYREALRRGVRLEPITLFLFHRLEAPVIEDGNHRLAACRAEGRIRAGGTFAFKKAEDPNAD
jgi:hypothetical protein